MAHTPEEVCVLALSHLGNTDRITSITTPTTTNEKHCANFYAIARDAALSYTDWKFASRKALLWLDDLSDDGAELNGEWGFAYVMPEGAVKVLKVLPEGAPKNTPSEDFSLYSTDTGGDGGDETVTLIVTNLGPTAYADYVLDITDPNFWTPSFTLAVSYYLASLLANPVVKGKSGITMSQAAMSAYEVTILRAATNDAKQEQNSDYYQQRPAPWIANR